MDIIGITVSVNYDDILKHLLEQNSKILKLWYIITSPEDKNTIDLVNEANLSNVKLLIYNDFKKNASFNKGGGLLFGQEHVYQTHGENNNILILDSDIYLPDNMLEILADGIKDDTIYSAFERFDYSTLNDFINRKNPKRPWKENEILGFFQLYKGSSKYKYKSSNNCGICDENFRNLFNGKRELLNITVCHLGNARVSWNGRDKFRHKFT
jgi:hypothetical protein